MAAEYFGEALLRDFRALISKLRLHLKESHNILPIVQSILSKSPSSQRDNLPPLKKFLGRDPTTQVQKFLHTSTMDVFPIPTVIQERAVNVEELQRVCADLHPVIKEHLRGNRERGRRQAYKGMLPNFTEGDYVPVARTDFHAGEKLFL